MANELILIIEDNEKSRRLARDVLQFKGYQTIESESAEQGIELARQQQPALILMDFHLPGMNGIEALKVLRADAATASIPVLAVTASTMREDRKNMMLAGFDGLQTKPLNVKVFLAAVEDTLKKCLGRL